MQAFRRTIFLLLLISLYILPYGKQKEDQPDYLRLYRYAEKLYNKPAPTATDDSLALAAYTRLVSLLSKDRLNDSILCDASFKAAIYHQTNGDNNKAIEFFRYTLKFRNTGIRLPETSFYLPNLYTGNAWYFLGRYDSARYYYKQAELIALSNPGLRGLERLYNTMGVLNFESGNYQQSKTYFEKAVQLLEATKNPEIALLVNFKSNLATSLRKLEAFEQSMQIYKSLLQYNSNKDELYHNIASIYLSTGENEQALKYLSLINESGLNTFNDLGLAYFRKNNDDSAFIYFKKALVANIEENEGRKNLYHGSTLRYLGDYYRKKNQYHTSLKYYQEALMQLVFSFQDTAIKANPKDFLGIFSVNELFETLANKGAMLQLKYGQSGNQADLEMALNTFHSLYELADYAEKTYENDDARILLNKKKHLSHDQPIQTSLQLYALTGDKKYLEQAFYFDERNKASSLTVELLEKDIKHKTGIPDSLIALESFYKENISRLSLRSADLKDSMVQQKVLKDLLEWQIKLSELEKQFINYPEYERLKFSHLPITLDELRKKIIPDHAAIISFHIGDKNILQWIISQTVIDYRIIPLTDSLFESINALAETMEPENSNRGFKAHARRFYQLLIKPIESVLSGYSSLMIIPDDELNRIPFEILLDEKNEYLVKNFEITYNSSCTLLTNPNDLRKKTLPYSLLAMAPFSSSNQNQQDFAYLPASAEEVRKLDGKVLLGEDATKNAFVSGASKYSILHLATHARADEEVPGKSFIAFYRQRTDSPALSYNLFTREIYDLKLTNTWLTVLTACETGTGQLVKGEGMMSLSRAFSFAGCPNIITTQWKADDKATAFISKRLHHYLEKGNSIANSLRKAKLDYLEDKSIDNRFKTPGYWAQLRLIGQFDENNTGIDWYWLILPLIAILVFIAIKKVLRSRTSRGISRS